MRTSSQVVRLLYALTDFPGSLAAAIAQTHCDGECSKLKMTSGSCIGEQSASLSTVQECASLANRAPASQSMAASAATSVNVASSARDVDACRAECWIPVFPRIGPRYLHTALSADIVRFIHQDGMLLPPPPAGTVLRERDPRFEAPPRLGGLVLSHKDGDDARSDAGSSTEQVLEPPPALEAEQAWIETSIAKLGGMVVPRLSWATPHDAAWINGGEVQCGSVGEVLTVLKASDDVTEALESSWAAADLAPHAQADGSVIMKAEATSAGALVDAEVGSVAAEANRELLLLCHADLAADPGHCFRVFVHAGRALGVSQRVPHVMFPAAVRRADEAAAAAFKLVPKLTAKSVTLPDGSSHVLSTCESLSSNIALVNGQRRVGASQSHMVLL